MPSINLKEKVKNGELDLSSQGLKEIPLNVIANAKNITSINLSNNKIASVGKGIGNLTQLVKLDLSKNQIKGLPESIGNLAHLKHLNLSNNQLSSLPTSVGHLKSLKVLDVKNNPLNTKFAEIVGPCHNDTQCHQAARNVIKAFSSPENNKKKQQKDQAEPDAKKKKTTNDKNSPNGINQVKQKSKSKKKGSRSFSSRVFGVLKYLAIGLVVAFTALYVLSEYDDKFKTTIGSTFNNTLTTLLGEKSAQNVISVSKTVVQVVGGFIIATFKFVFEKLCSLYVYITTDEKIRLFLANVGAGLNNIRLKILETFQNLTSSQPAKN